MTNTSETTAEPINDEIKSNKTTEKEAVNEDIEAFLSDCKQLFDTTNFYDLLSLKKEATEEDGNFVAILI